MADNTKRNTLILGLLGLLALAVGLLTNYFTSGSLPEPVPSVTGPSPQPSPTQPAPSPSSLPSPSPSFTPSPSPSVVPLVTRYTTENVVTTTPSFTGARVGEYADVLVPSATGAVIDNLPTPTSFPFYAEMNFDAISRAFGIADSGTTFAQRARIYVQALNLLKSFGVQPVKHGVYSQPTDWDANSTLGVSYRQLVLTHNLYAPCLAGPRPYSAQNVTFLRMVEAAIQSGEIPRGAWIYLYDEPTSAEYADLVAQARIIRANAPSLKIMVTMRPAPEVAGFVDIYSPVNELWHTVPPQLMAYGSCMAQGSCTSGVVHTPTGTPLMVLDADPVNWTAYPVVLAGIGAQMGLYYNTTEQLSRAPGGMYKFAGNGDGTLVYAGANFTVLPSARLLGIKRGLAKIAAMKAQGRPLSGLVTNAKQWSKNPGDYAP